MIIHDEILVEEWREVVGFEGSYYVSSHGRVKSRVKKKEIVLKQERHYKGYWKVDLCKNGICKKQFVHRLVAIAFIPNPLAKPIVNHKDWDRGNNALPNLEWMDEEENSNWKAEKVKKDNESF